MAVTVAGAGEGYPLEPLPLTRAVDEFALTTVLLFVVVTAVRGLLAPSSPLAISDLDTALGVVGIVAGATLTALIFSPPGRRSGAHMNPAVTVALWLMDVFPGRSVLPYVMAQLAGSVAGTALARWVWGHQVAVVDYSAVRPAPSWRQAAVFLSETGCLIGVVLLVGFFLANPKHAAVLPWALGIAVGLIIAFLGPLSGGSANPARQFGPAVLSGRTRYLWIYLVAPILGAVLGASVHHLLIRRFNTHRPLTYKLAGAGRHDNAPPADRAGRGSA
ncbi:aquaporin family protein [Streptomyces sp. NBC_01476]|uniref:MIP/aquaporin family protein n=1 Tax=Streptomyces sp. NBC_01476 TaxID=2903881 RepID=UPI002E311848|nr:MIP/aquaporin family protein [Streptomyces sp. NBC_01476]